MKGSNLLGLLFYIIEQSVTTLGAFVLFSFLLTLSPYHPEIIFASLFRYVS